jgi:hypothetical protein
VEVTLVPPVPAPDDPRPSGAPVLEGMVPLPPAVGSPAVPVTTVFGRSALPRSPAPRLLEALTAARAAGIRAEVRARSLPPETAARATTTGVAEPIPSWSAMQRGRSRGPSGLVEAAAGHTTVALSAGSIWRAGAPGVLRWDASGDCRVLLLDADGSLTADERSSRGALEVPAGAACVLLGGGAPAGAVAAGWYATDPVLWLGQVTGAVPGGIVHLLGVPVGPGARPVGALPPQSRLAVAATGTGVLVRSIAVLLPGPATVLPAGVALTVRGSAPTGPPLVAAVPAGGSALVWPVPDGPGPAQVVLDAGDVATAEAPVGLLLGIAEPDAFAGTLGAVPAPALTGTHRTTGSALLTWEATG